MAGQPRRKKRTAGEQPAADVRQMGRDIKNRLAQMGITDGPSKAPAGLPATAWTELRKRVIADVTRDVIREWELKRQGVVVPDFTPLSPDDVASPPELEMWMVKGLWALGSHGVIAGPKKSLKSTFHDAMALGIASGQKVLGEWEVVEPGPVLLYAGEGSIDYRKRDLQRLAHDLYGVKIGTGEGQAQIHIVPKSYPFNTPEFRRGLIENINDIQPIMVTLDSTYNYHPKGVNTADMYDRGPLFAELSSLVRDCKQDASLVLVDHMRQAASLNLDAINMAGVAQWADSWVLAIVGEGDPEFGRFTINMEVASRRWGGRRKTVDWNLGRLDENTLEWSNPISTSVVEGSYEQKGNRATNRLDQVAVQIVKDKQWELTLTQLVDAVGGNKDKARECVNSLISQRIIAVEPRKRHEGSREVTRELVGIPSDSHVRPPGVVGKQRSKSARKKGRG